MFKKEKVLAFIETHMPLLYFSAFVLLSLVALIVFQTKALKEMRERNDSILSHYEQVLSITQSRGTEGNIDLVPYINEFNMTPSQSIAFLDYTYAVVETAVARSQVDTEIATMVEAKAKSMYQETKDLLEMQFAKIQHETESLQIWCGILTVVFLIFSFYSLFKTDELVQQGKDGVKELALLQASGKKSIDGLKSEGDKKIKEFETASRLVIAKAGQKVEMEKQKLLETVEGISKGAQDKIEKKYLDATEGLDKKYQDLEEALESRRQELEKKEVERDNDILKQLITRVENLNLRLQEVERIKNENNG